VTPETSRRLLTQGQALATAIEDTSIFRTVPIDPSSVLRDAIPWLIDLPTVPTQETTQEEANRLANAHGFTALKLGLDPDDPCLHWFAPEHFLEFFPSAQELLAFEDGLLRYIGRAMVTKGQMVAMARLEKVFGQCSTYERRDWTGLMRAYARDFVSTDTEDDRQVMILRLEGIIRKAQEALDLKTELSAVRQLQAIQGLLFQDQEKTSRETQVLLNYQRPRDPDLARITGPTP
jgi:hypothetical protein